jgi:hypothetical protein
VGALATETASNGARAVFQGLALASGPDGYALNTAMADLGNGIATRWLDLPAFDLTADATADERRALHSYIENLSLALIPTNAVNRGWVQLNAANSRDLLGVVGVTNAAATAVQRTTGTRVSALLGHELQHGVTGFSAHDPHEVLKLDERLGWLEEGTATLLGNWPGTAASRATAMGIPSDGGDWVAPADHPYNPWAEGARKLVRLAGVDVTSADGMRGAADLLQRQRLSRVPGVLARRIIEHNGIAPARYDELRGMIAESGGKRSAVSTIEHWVAKHGQ